MAIFHAGIVSLPANAVDDRHHGNVHRKPGCGNVERLQAVVQQGWISTLRDYNAQRRCRRAADPEYGRSLTYATLQLRHEPQYDVGGMLFRVHHAWKPEPPLTILTLRMVARFRTA